MRLLFTLDIDLTQQNRTQTVLVCVCLQFIAFRIYFVYDFCLAIS